MIVKSFLLTQDTLQRIAAQCGEDTVAIIRPENQIEKLLREAIGITLREKKSAAREFEAIRAYFDALSQTPQYRETVAQTVDGLSAYLRESMYIQMADHAVDDYVMAKCARLCAEAVNSVVKGTLIDGTELMICHTAQHFDWLSSRDQILARIPASGPVVIPGGYGRLNTGYVVRVGKDGAHLMASLIGATLKADSVTFFVEGPGVAGVPAMTYDEAAHYCASSRPPFSSYAIWPAKNANIPIVVKDILDDGFGGTVISTASVHGTGILQDQDLDLITVYGTGLLGRVGMSSSIFSAMAREHVNVRFIAQTSSEYSISFAVRSKDKDVTLAAIRSLFQQNPLLPLDDVVVLNQAVGIVTIFGSKMRNLPGTSATVYSKLGEAGINIIASAQGGEELSISLVVAEEDTAKVAALLQ